jgi:hypothetical protein
MKTGKYILTIWLAAWLAQASVAESTSVARPNGPAPAVKAQPAPAQPGAATAHAAKPVLSASAVNSAAKSSVANSKVTLAPALPSVNAPKAKPSAANTGKQSTKAAVGDSSKTIPNKVAEKAGTTRVNGGKDRRDPFVSPIVERVRATGPACTGTGKRCLYVGEINLQGIVESGNNVIAVVASGDRTYFLREHDSLADGDVEKITRDALTMRQRSSDVLGRVVVHEVTRKLGPA